MAARKVNVSEMPKQHGLQKLEQYAKEHGFHVFSNTYKIVPRHEKQKMKEIGPYGRLRISSRPNNVLCEVLQVSTLRRNGEEIRGFLIGSDSGIRFSAHERY